MMCCGFTGNGMASAFQCGFAISRLVSGDEETSCLPKKFIAKRFISKK